MIETSILVGSPQASATKLLSLGDLSCTAMIRASGPELGTDWGGGEKAGGSTPGEKWESTSCKDGIAGNDLQQRGCGHGS